MALATAATKPKITSKAKTVSKSKLTKQTLANTLLMPTNPYELLSERMSSLDTKIDSVKNELLTEIKSTHTRIDATNIRIDNLEKNLNTRIDATNIRIDNLEKNLNTRIDATNTRIDSLERSINHRMDDLKSSFARGNTIVALTIATIGLGIALLQIFIK